LVKKEMTMRGLWLAFAILTAAGFLAGAAADGEGSFDQATLQDYDIALITLQTPITLPDAAGRDIIYRQAYLVRLHGEFPKNRAPLLRLYFGEEAIPQFGGLPEGLYFMVFDEARLKALAGKEISCRFGEGPAQKLNMTFEPRRWTPFKTMPEKDAFLRPWEAR
jgi:hypothetical protein